MQPIHSQQNLTAYYKTTLSIFFVVCGAFAIIASILIAKTLSLMTVLGVLVILFGLYCLHRPYFLLEPRKLTVYNILGLVKKQYTFESWAVVKADNRRIYIDDGGITKKVPVAPWLVKAEDWLAMRKML
ncbi:MAG: hypothetical protein AB8B99_20085 [Phormidesmis sp.]